MNIIFNIDTWIELWHTVKKNKLRTSLTLIGVAWGMFLFVVLLGAAKGLENGFNKQFEGVASNSMFLWAQQTSEPHNGFPRGRSMNLKLKDVEYLKTKVSGIKNIIPRNVLGIRGSAPSGVTRGLKKGNYTTYGDYPELNKFQKIQLKDGRFINQKDIDQKRKTCVIGERVVKELFETDENPIGQNIQINGLYFQIVGVYVVKQGGWLQDNSIMMPFLTFQEIFNQGDNIGWMAITAADDTDIKKFETQIKSALKRKYDVSPSDDEAFGSFNLGEIYGKFKGFLLGMQILTIFVGILTIIAGVIAISNILLITVKERTKEIGVRRALGAKPNEIRAQVLLESVVLTLIAGISGFVLATYFLFLFANLPFQKDFLFYYISKNPIFPLIFFLLINILSLILLLSKHKKHKKSLRYLLKFIFFLSLIILLNILLLSLFGIMDSDSEFPLLNPTVSPLNIVLAIIVMTFFGLLIGLLPANRAVRIKPIEALRTE